MTLPAALQRVLDGAAVSTQPVSSGRVRSVRGIAIHVAGLRAAIGEVCTIRAGGGDLRLPAEVVGFDGDNTVLMALGDMQRVAPWDAVENAHRPLEVVTGGSVLGRVLDALGRPIDGGPPLTGAVVPVTGEPPQALQRAPIQKAIETGVAAIDGLLTIGRGQRVGIFAGSGVGKSTLMGTIARGKAAQVNVIALIGERGREVREFVDGVLGPQGLAKSVVVVCTSDQAPMLRLKAPFTAVAIAEAFRREGKDVMFLMDSVTRFAMAAREVGLAAGEPPTLRGYPPSLFAHLPRLVERLGNDACGSITGLLTVLVDGDDLNEPVSDALRGYLDGHVVLSRRIAQRGRFPSIDVLASISRLMPAVTSDDQQKRARRLREWQAHFEENRDLIAVGAYRKGGDALLDKAVEKMPAIEQLLFHADSRPMAETLARLQQIAGA